MINTCVIAGRLVRDIEIRVTPAGTPVGTFTLAVDRPKFGDREKQTDFIDCVLWGERAEKLAQYLTKGKPIAVIGALQTRTYEDKNGNKRKVAEINVNELRFLPGGNGQQAKQEVLDSKEIPFNEEEIPF